MPGKSDAARIWNDLNSHLVELVCEALHTKEVESEIWKVPGDFDVVITFAMTADLRDRLLEQVPAELRRLRFALCSKILQLEGFERLKYLDRAMRKQQEVSYEIYVILLLRPPVIEPEPATYDGSTLTKESVLKKLKIRDDF